MMLGFPFRWWVRGDGDRREIGGRLDDAADGFAGGTSSRRISAGRLDGKRPVQRRQKVGIGETAKSHADNSPDIVALD
jgi:hypothetical protein